MRTWILQFVVPIFCAASFLLGVVVLGRAAGSALQQRSTYQTAFEDIDCRPPDGMSKLRFLQEVRAFSPHFEQLHLMDGDCAARLFEVFSRHPRVESVRRVKIERSNSSPGHRKATFRLSLVYRQAVLAVRMTNESPAPTHSLFQETAENVSRKPSIASRAVDARGVLLPVDTDASQLPVLMAVLSAPSGAAGSRWEDPQVTAAAATVAFLQNQLDRLHLRDSLIEFTDGEIVFRKPGVRVVWGHAPGMEKEGEAPAQVKVQRLLRYTCDHNGLESLEHDVRLLAFQGHFPLSSDAQP